MPRPSRLPDDLRQILEVIGRREPDEPVPASSVNAAIAGLHRLPPETVAAVGREIVSAMGWRYRYYEPPSLLDRLFNLRRSGDLDWLKRHPDYAWLLLFHPNGWLREAALDSISTPPTSAFQFASIALRLNDWVDNVRAAAVRCGDRVFMLTAPDVAAHATLALLDRPLAWRRWNDEERKVLDLVFSNAGTRERFVPLIMYGATGPLAQRLTLLLRRPDFDEALPALACSAVQPSVRATALRTLITGAATWAVGHEWRCFDKAYNLGRWVPVTQSRKLGDRPSVDMLIRQGLEDRSAFVRLVAADALIEHRAALPDHEALAARMAQDPSPSLRDRADYMARHPLEA